RRNNSGEGPRAPTPTPSPAADFLCAHRARSKEVIGIICPGCAGSGQIGVHSEGDEMSERAALVIAAATIGLSCVARAGERVYGVDVSDYQNQNPTRTPIDWATVAR